MGAVDLESDQIVAAHAHVPRRIDVGDDAAFKLERGISGVVGVRIVRLAVFVHALWNVRCAQAIHRLHFAEQIVEHVAPVTEHIEDDAAAFGLAVVPARPLRRLAPVAFEHPITELAAHREHAAEETGVAQHPDLAQPRQEKFVLDDAVFQLFRLRELGHGDRLVETVGDRLFAIDVLAGLDRLGQEIGAHLRRRRIEKHFIVAVFQRRVEVGREALDAVLTRQRSDLFRVAADQNGVGHYPVAIGQRHAALLADRNDRTHQVLIESHAPGDAVHHDAEPAGGHACATPSCDLRQRYMHLIDM